MSRQGMMQLSDVFIDSLDFARGGRRMDGVVAVRSLRRLADALADDEGELTWSVRGETATDNVGQRQAYLLIEVGGEIRLICQRCLGALPYRLAIESRLLLVPPGKPWPEEDLEDPERDSPDPIEALIEQSLLDLVEDEVLLALPIAPRHESCDVPEHDDGKAAASPFARLAQLKKH